MEKTDSKNRITLNDDLYVRLPLDWDYDNESYSEEDWKEAFHWLHIHWDSRIGKEVVDAFEENATKFCSPHSLSDKIFRSVFKSSESPVHVDWLDEEEYVDRIEEFMLDEYKNDKATINNLAEICIAAERKIRR